MSNTFDNRYPNLKSWLQDGWIEVGYDGMSASFFRVLDTGGLVWESDREYETLQEAFADADAAIAHWLEENGK